MGAASFQALRADPAALCARTAELRHIAARLLTIHNLAWLLALVDEARSAIAAGTLDDLHRRVVDVWG